MRKILASINPRSVRFRTTAGAAIALLALLVVAGLAINWFVGRAVERSFDTALLEQATDRALLLSDGAPIDSLTTPVGYEQVVAAIAPDGSVLAASGLAPDTIQIDVRIGLSDIELTKVESGESREREQLRAAVAESSTGVRILVANEGESAQSTKAAVRTILLAIIPLTAAAGALVSWLVTGRALTPVRNMRRELGDVVRAGDGQRVSEPGTRDEIDELGGTINGVLDRLDAQTLAQRRFVADASHELKSPLANARAIIDTAANDVDQLEYERVTGSVSTELNRLHTLVDDLLYLARGDEGPPRSPAPTDLADLIFDECERVAATSQKHIDASGVIPVEAIVDGAEVARALRNLIENAERFAVDRVSVAVATTDDSVLVTVGDDGPGIAPGDRASVFERFTRIDTDRGRAAGGTGLGLSIVASIIERHAGHIEVGESAAGGAQFTISFPRAT